MNQPIRRLGIVLATLFVTLFISTTMIQFVNAKEINAKANNRRTLLNSYDRQRGQIVVAGKPIAQSVPVNDELAWLRKYQPGTRYAHVTGYYSFTYGTGGGLEHAEDPLLSGQSDKLFLQRVTDMVTGKSPTGASIELTINPAAQAAADKALGKQRGAVVALDPRTGAILAMVSHPSYDPNSLATHDNNAATKAWSGITKNPGRPLVDRSINELYPPGSTFKLVVAAAALESGKYTPKSQLPGGAALKLPQTTATLPNHGNQPCSSSGKVSLADAMRISCNPAFGALGMELGADAVAAQARKFGFDQSLTVPMDVTPSRFPPNLNQPQLAQSSIGQFSVTATPMEMAMVSAAIANKGVLMQPYLVQRSITDQDLSVIDEASPTRLGQAISPTVAQQLSTMMRSVVTSGTGTAAAARGVEIAGKTGTAEHGGDAPHAWFTAFAPAENPTIAVAVVVEDGGNAGSEAAGGSVAGPIAREVITSVVKP